MKNRSAFVRSLEAITKEKNLAQPSESELGRLLAQFLQHKALARRASAAGMVEALKGANPEGYKLLSEAIRRIGIAAARGQGQGERYIKLLGEDSGLGAATATGEIVVPQMFDSLPLGGAWSYMATATPDAVTGKFPVATVRPAAKFIITEGDTLDDDTAAAGTSVLTTTQLAGVCATLSREWVEDAGKALVEEWLGLAIESLNVLVDGAALNGTGAADSTNGSVTGVFQTSGIPTMTAAAGNVSVQAVGRGDLVNMVSAVEGSANQHDPRFFAHPAFLGPLMNVVDNAGRPVLRTAIETGSDEEFSLIGLPLTLTAGAPSTNAANTKVLAFGRPTAYAVGVARAFEITASTHKSFNTAGIVYRILLRAGGIMKRKESWAILKTAAV